MAAARCKDWSKTHRGLSVIISSRTPGLRGTTSVSSAHVAAPLPGRARACDNSRWCAVDLKTSYCLTRLGTDSASVTHVKLLCVSQSDSATLPPPPDTRMTWCQYQETFFTIAATKSHTPNHESLFQSRQRDGQHTNLLALNSLRREPAESKTSRTRAATTALKMAIFRLLFSTLPLRCEGKRLVCLSFVLKLVSRQKNDFWLEFPSWVRRSRIAFFSFF